MAADLDERRTRGPQSLAEHDTCRLLEMNRHAPRRSNLHITSTLAHHAVKSIFRPAQAGNLNVSGLRSSAQHMRAFFAAIATIAFQ
jgi:hypothetical protein